MNQYWFLLSSKKLYKQMLELRCADFQQNSFNHLLCSKIHKNKWHEYQKFWISGERNVIQLDFLYFSNNNK